jgi:twitching motility protein PilT
VATIDAFLTEVIEKRGSDLHFIAGDPPRIRLFGDLGPLRPDRLDSTFVKEALYEIMPKPALDRFESKDGADFAYTLADRGRFRVNVMRQLNGVGGVFRIIPSKALTMDELKLPQSVREMARATNGLILVTGKTGSGKSTTLASMVDDINTRLKGHILTIEDPIEFVHVRKSCLISQREIGVHSASFADALHSALREDPDVILVGELRDLETMSIGYSRHGNAAYQRRRADRRPPGQRVSVRQAVARAHHALNVAAGRRVAAAPAALRQARPRGRP